MLDALAKAGVAFVALKENASPRGGGRWVQSSRKVDEHAEHELRWDGRLEGHALQVSLDPAVVLVEKALFRRP